MNQERPEQTGLEGVSSRPFFSTSWCEGEDDVADPIARRNHPPENEPHNPKH